jgi:hypothetical protein
MNCLPRVLGTTTLSSTVFFFLHVFFTVSLNISSLFHVLLAGTDMAF